jgi:peptidoglycan/xylan/chitin deacetylase (PgdA/CDA1 family)
VYDVLKGSARSLVKNGVIKAVTTARLDEATRLFLKWESQQSSKAPILVMNYHDVPKSEEDNFRRQLEWVSSEFDIIDFAEFDRRFSCSGYNAEDSTRPGVLLTFDDGLVSHLEVVAPLLEDKGLRGVFFVVPGFCEKKGYLSVDGIKELGKRGNTLGCHTMNHASLEKTPENQLKKEIIDSGEVLGDWIGADVEAFAWTFAWNRIDYRAWEMIRGKYRYCFTPCPGVVRPSETKPWSIWRTNVEAYYHKDQYKLMYSGIPELIWNRKRRWLRRISGKIESQKSGGGEWQRKRKG